MRMLLAGLLLGSLCVLPARADSIGFGGSVLDSCALTLGNAGTLAMSPDGTVLGSEEGAGQSAHVTVLSTGSHTINVAAPTLTASPAGYDPTDQQLEVAYQGQSLLSGVSQAYTTSPSSFPVGTIALTTLTLNNRVVNDKGFASGSYQTQTVVTCN